ncbi:MAG: hypothetical protein GOP50_10410 [Candidatus Heimdallarchaeota archaeon]|nr:hypothetical protein [Candidatus Heimdallarchaeota archaeon]
MKKKKFTMSLSILIILFLLNSNFSLFNAKAFANRNTNQLNAYTLDESIWMWTITEVVSTESTEISYQPAIAADSYGDVHIVWRDYTDYLSSGTDIDIFYKRWDASTSLWTATEIVSTISSNNSEYPAIAVDAEGNAHIAWSEENEYDESGADFDIFYRFWNTTTSSWNTTEVISTESTSTSRDPSIIVDSKKNVHIAWMDYTNYAGSGSGPPDIFYKFWNASLSTWTITEVISANSTFWADYPSIDVDSEGNVYLAWHDYTDILDSGGDSDIFYNYRNVSISSWNSTELVSTGSTAGSGIPSLAVDTTGNVHIAWEDSTANLLGSGADIDVFYRCWNASTNSWSTLEVVTTESDDLSVDASIAVDSIGNVHVTWKQWYGIFYKFWDSYSSTWTSVEMISTESTMDVQNPSLAVDTTRNVHIVWADNTDYDSSGSDRDIFYKKTEEPPVFPEMVFNLPFSNRAIIFTVMIFCISISLFIVRKRYKKN